MKLFELLNKPVEWDKTYDFTGGEEHYVEFTTPKGRKMTFKVAWVNKNPTTFEMEFADDEANRYEDRFGITGKGDQLAIFATVLEMAQKFIQQNPNTVLYMSAEEPSRIKLYESMMRRFVKPPLAYFSKSKYHETGFWIGQEHLIQKAVNRDLGAGDEEYSNVRF